MKFAHDSKRGRRCQSGQTLVLFALFLVIILLFVGLGIDAGFAYISKANLSKAVDAACLTGIRNLPLGQAQATALAASAFAANYGRPGRDTGSVTPNISFSVDANNNVVIDVDATTVINTYFVRLLPRWKTMTVSAQAQATRARVIMALVLDRSGSMGMPAPAGSGGGAAFPGAVSTFINNFDDNLDQAAMSSFASAATLDFPMGHPFKAAIKTAANAFKYTGRTFADGGLQIGYTQIQNALASPGQNVVRVAVFFTDGFANTFQDTFSCSTNKLNLGQGDPFGGGTYWSLSFMDPATGGNVSCNSTTFQSIDGTTKTISQYNQNVWLEGQLRALATANQMRSANILIYSIGLGDQLNRDFLKQIANDPTASSFNPNQIAGEALFAPSPDQLAAVFQQVATKILLRLTK